MKKIISSLMIDLLAAMAVPAFDHKHPPAHHFDKKSMPPKHR